jgi:hypothetical protein
MFVWQKRADNLVHILIQIMRQNRRRHSKFQPSSRISRKKGVRSVRLRLISAADSATVGTGLRRIR